MSLVSLSQAHARHLTARIDAVQTTEHDLRGSRQAQRPPVMNCYKNLHGPSAGTTEIGSIDLPGNRQKGLQSVTLLSQRQCGDTETQRPPLTARMAPVI